ncbi:MAG TPA: lipoate--protein ligase family protein [Acidimicrobiia bacterium]|nr:lipoate--protein ligase family protein [Acidimicrobiia bacterium]
MLQLFGDSYPDDAGLDTGISHALVLAVGEGRMPPSFRLHTTRRIVAFGRQDRASPGYAAAVDAARELGYLPLERMAGGRAAVFHEGTLAFSWAVPASDPRAGITARFTAISGFLADAFRDLGADARVGELPGEYCPGAYSVNIAGASKVMGVGQRLVRGAAHVGGVIVVDGGRRIAEALSPVYRELGIPWEPTTAGDLRDHLPDLTIDATARAVIARLAAACSLSVEELPGWLVDEGRRLAPAHVATAGPDDVTSPV